MEKYFKAKLFKKSGKRNYYAFLTVPQNLRPLLNGKKQIYKSTGTDDYEEARDKLRQLEAELYLQLDQAELANHPLVKAANDLQEVLRYGVHWKPKDWFDPIIRWEAEDDVRSRAGKSISMIREIEKENGVTDKAVSVLANLDHDLTPDQVRQYLNEIPSTEKIDSDMPPELKPDFTLDVVERIFIQIERLIKPSYEEFVSEFRKVSEEKYAPTKRSKPFAEVAEEWFASSLFLNSKRTDAPKREKTKNEQINKVQVFMDWAGNVSLDDFSNSLATRFAEDLTNQDSKLVKGGAANETVHKYFNAVRAVLDWGVRNDYMASNRWEKFSLGGYGRAKQKYRDFSEEELRQLFSLKIPTQDRTLLAILACTGARLDEIALLTWQQLHEDQTNDGQRVAWLDTTDAIVKNQTSKRLIPLVPEVAELITKHRSFKNPKDPDRLFTYAKDRDGKAENKASRAIMPHLRKISSDPTFVIHSLRHTFNTMCRNAGIDWELREFIQGRGGSGVGSRYGQPAHVKKQLDEIGQIDYSFLQGNLAISKTC